jgi:hypothetical protein
MAIFAQLENDIVVNIIIADNLEWVNENLLGSWIEALPEYNSAGIGWTWDSENSVFISPMPNCGHDEISFNTTTFTWECGNGIHDEPIS